MADAYSSAAVTGEPTIDPTSFDLIIWGTGLAESLIAAAVAARGKSVLHLDSNPYYGAHFASLSPHSLSSLLQRNAPLTNPAPEQPPSNTTPYVAVNPEPRCLYSQVEISGDVPEPSRSFLLDLSGPRVLYCADRAVDVMLRSRANHHVEFKSVDATLLYWQGELRTVPDSREAIFKDKSLGLTEKSHMMRFLKLVREHIGKEGGEGEEGSKIPEEDLEIPFAAFLEKQRLPPVVKSIVLYAIAMTDYDQDNPEDSEKIIATKEGLASLSRYSLSIGRFANAVGALIYPMYGQGELPQAFCRCAAVKGALYVLRMPISSLLFDKVNKEYKGVRLASGQDISSHQFLMDSSFLVPPFSSLDIQDGGCDRKNVKIGQSSSMASKVARLVCITRSSLHHELSNILIVFPPRSLFPGQEASVRALHLGSSAAVCPPGFYVVYLSAKCNNAIQGKEHVLAAMNTLFKLPCWEDKKDGTNNLGEDSGILDNGRTGEPKPDLLWSAFYVQELTQVTVGSISSSPMPDGNLDYRGLLESTEELFHSMYPQEEFFPATLNTEDNDEDGDSQG